MKKYVVSISILITLFMTATYAAQNRNCDLLYARLNENQIRCEKYNLANAIDEEFPYSILITKNSSVQTENELLVVIPQSTAINMSGKLIEFIQSINSIQDENLKYAVKILLSANDYAKIPALTDYAIPGITSFIDSIEYENLNAIIISDYDKNRLSYASKNSATPPSFLKNILESCTKSNAKLSMENASLGFSRIGAAKSNPILEYLLKSEIPAVHLSAQNESFDAALYFINNFDIFHDEEWDSQYFVISFLSHPLFLYQKVLFIILSADIVISLFLLCFSFLLGKYAFSRSDDLKRTFFMPFAIFIFTFISLLVSQELVTSLLPNWQNIPVLSFAIKCIMTVAFYCILANLRFFVSLPQTSYIYGFYLNLSSFLNIMIFSLYDLSFLPYFTITYLIAIISWKSIRKPLQIVCFVLSLIIFIPLLIVDKSISQQICAFYTDATVFDNFMFSILSCPYIFMIIRFRSLADLYKNHKVNEYKVLLKNLIIMASIFAFIMLLTPMFNIITKYFKNSYQETTITKTEAVQKKQGGALSVSTAQNFTLDRQNIRVKINADGTVARYIVKVRSNSLLPIYDSNYPFDTFTEKNTAIFYFEENPPSSLNLELSSKIISDLNFEIIYYQYPDENENIMQYIMNFQIKGSVSNGKSM
ncbi:MAG: hypothetical protein K6G52_01920 [Treponemataceae bacterium]|nr:hypothetical protein [Treponemataceae bacterium]